MIRYKSRSKCELVYSRIDIILPLYCAFFRCSCWIFSFLLLLFCNFTTPYPAPAHKIGTKPNMRHM